MKILMTSSGGIVKGMEGWYEHGLAKALVKRGHEITVYSSSSVAKNHQVENEEKINGINVKRFNPLMPGSFFEILKGNWDIIHAHHLGYLAPISSYSALRKKFKDIPYVFNVTGLYHDPYLVKDVNDPFSSSIKRTIQGKFPINPLKIPEWFVHLPLYNSDKIIALTEWEKKELTKYRIPKDKIKAIPIGIDLKKYKRKNTKFFKNMGITGKTLLFVGQPTRRKGWEYFIRSLPYIKKDFPDIKAVFIGYRSDSKMETLVKSMTLENNVVFLGYLSEEKKISAFQSCDSFVFPTLYEGFGMIFLEAMASGSPIVTTNVASNSEIVKNNVNGLLVKPKNETEVAKGVIKILNNKPLVNKIKRNNLRDVKRYSWDTLVEEYLKVYEETVKNKRKN